MKRQITRTKHRRYCTVTIELTGDRLSITGEEGRITSHARYIGESFGQIVDELRNYFPEIVPLLPWHLNDMKAGCEHQEALGWNAKEHLSKPCPTCGYKYGSAWLKRELPPEIITLAHNVLKDEEVSCFIRMINRSSTQSGASTSKGVAPMNKRGLKGYVRTSSGRFYVCVPDDSQWGFSLCSDDQSWPGGIGIATEWAAVASAEVPADVRAELDWLLDESAP